MSDPPGTGTTPPTKAGKAVPFTQGHALLIGVGKHSYESWSLPVARADAEAFDKVLVDIDRCAYPSEQIHLLTNEKATRSGILEAMASLERATRDKPNSTIILYYSGHGWQDRDGHYYLVPFDTLPSDLARTALRAEDFAKAIERIRPERLLVILDTCHAAGMAQEGLALAGIRRDAPPEDLAKILGKGKGRAILSSCQGEEKSWILEDRERSIFTHHLIEAFGGKGTPPEAGYVSVLDLMYHVDRAVRKSAKAQKKTQTPYFEMEAVNFSVAQAPAPESEPEPGPEAKTFKVASQAPSPAHKSSVIYGDVVAEGADIEGSVFTHSNFGPGAVVAGRDLKKSPINTGDHATQTVSYSPQAHSLASQIDIAREIEAVGRLLMALDLPSKEQRRVENAIEESTDEARSSDPDKAVLGETLERALKAAKGAGELIKAASALRPHLEQAVSWLGPHWRQLLSFTV